ncbi:protein DEHYDRATION-INDUCED 19 homolog 5-like isoform X2 [Lycium ferocissimum]|uniref:protein DEHYDRATION-INDUCED 19 homolog 5-like isoform X2 n=1 Tax=Lycium ferocissimum TaxID=112874 RepID=UPI0028154428|nr:protein DEHYDRATION-INDUCED 19 homolog 5-like isoform X2 [Lycium ferocissimum]
MDVDFWAARINSARHLSAVQTNRLSNYDTLSNVDNTEGEGDVRAWFPCPFCYVEIEVQVLCNHLQEEHCFDFKNAVCPICAATLGKDPLGHFTMQHAQSVKGRRKYPKSGFWNNATAISGKDPHEINSLFCTNLMVGRYNVQEPAPDPLLLPFLCSMTPDPKDDIQDKSPGSVAAAPDVESSKLPICDPALEEQYEEKRQRAAFIQELIASTIF